MSNSTDDIYQVDWQGPFILQGEGNLLFNSPMATLNGIYLFAVEYNGGYLIQYAGLTKRSFKQRFQEHVRAYKNGVYTILDIEGFRQGERVVVWQGFWSKFKGRTLAINKDLNDEFESRYQEIKYATERLLSTYRIFLAPFDAPQRVLARVEASIMNILYSGEGVIRTFPDKGMSLAFRWSNEKVFLIDNCSKVCLHGLPALFEA